MQFYLKKKDLTHRPVLVSLYIVVLNVLSASTSPDTKKDSE